MVNQRSDGITNQLQMSDQMADQMADQMVRDQARKFISQFASIIIASTDDSGLPHCSYAPYIIEQGAFYLTVSGLAKHAQTLANGHASLLLIEDEKKAKTLFARARLTIQCDVSLIDHQNPNYPRLFDLLETKHGQTIQLIRSLSDFILFQLRPTNARYVIGFGAAYELPLDIFS